MGAESNKTVVQGTYKAFGRGDLEAIFAQSSCVPCAIA